MPLQVKAVSVDDLTLDPNNARKHNERDVNAIAASLKQFGQQTPLVVDSEGLIVKGNGTFMAAMKLGWDELEAVQTKLTGETLRAYAIADNRTSDLSEWDYDRLASELEAIEDEALRGATAFTDAEIDEMLAKAQPEDLSEVVEDEPMDLPEKATITKLGDIWTIGGHRIAIGDCCDEVLLDRLFGNKQAAACFTDPPYNIDLDTEASKGRKSKGRKIKNDSMDGEKFRAFLLEVFRVVDHRLAAGSPVYVCHADSEGLNFRAAYEASGLLLKQCLIWVKNSLVVGRQDYQWRHEPILYGWKAGARHKWYAGRKQTTVIDEDSGVHIEDRGANQRITVSFEGKTVVLDVPSYEVVKDGSESMETIWRFDRPTRSKEHPTMKPVRLVAYALANSTRKNTVVFDPFLGSGTTAAAAQQLGRQCYGCELDPRYGDVIIRRLEALTGEKAVKE